MKKLLRQISKRLAALAATIFIGTVSCFFATYLIIESENLNETNYEIILYENKEQIAKRIKAETKRLNAIEAEIVRDYSQTAPAACDYYCTPEPVQLVGGFWDINIFVNDNGTIELTRLAYGRFDTVTIDQPENLKKVLQGIFLEREGFGVYREGSTSEIEKTVVLNASKQAKYENVYRFVQAVKKAGAEPFMIDLDGVFAHKRTESKFGN